MIETVDTPELIVDPELEIIDSHFHLFDIPGTRYLLDEYLNDVGTGHNIVASIYCETKAFLRQDGPDGLKPLGEVEFANGMGAMSASGAYGPCRVAHGIIGHADMTQGAAVGELLDRCMEAAPERFRGVRQVTIEYPDDRPFRFVMTGRPPSGLLDSSQFTLGLREVAKRGLIFDAAVFDPSLGRLTEVVDAVPELTFVLNHMGIAIGLEMSPEERAEVFGTWSKALKRLAERPNVCCKVSGMGMPHWGFGFEERPQPATPAELAEVWRPYMETAIEAFGIQRCMMASNFPPDRRSGSYAAIWNGYKMVTRDASPSEKSALYKDTAARVYRLNL